MNGSATLVNGRLPMLTRKKMLNQTLFNYVCVVVIAQQIQVLMCLQFKTGAGHGIAAPKVKYSTNNSWVKRNVLK